MNAELTDVVAGAIRKLQRLELRISEVFGGDSDVDVFKKLVPGVVKLRARVTNEWVVEHLDGKLHALELDDAGILCESCEDLFVSALWDKVDFLTIAKRERMGEIKFVHGKRSSLRHSL